MTVGITGHQDLSKFNTNWIQLALTEFVLNNKIKNGVSSLAIGADQLFVQTLINNSIKFDVIIPCRQYELTFKNSKDLNDFHFFLDLAINIYTLDFPEPSEKAFYQAGLEIINKSSIIIAIWDGKKAKGFGGTADIVATAKKKGVSIFHINPIKQTHLFL